MKKPTQHNEHAEQVALFRWAAMMSHKHPELGLLYAIPNGARTAMITAKKLKAEGLRAGFPDIGLPVTDGDGHPGLFIEMKAPGGSMKKRQQYWKACLEAQGYAHVIAYSWVEAARAIYDYLGIDEEI